MLAQKLSFLSMCYCLWLPLIFVVHLEHHFFNILTLDYQTLNSSFLTQPSLRTSGEEKKKPNSSKQKEDLAPATLLQETSHSWVIIPKFLPLTPGTHIMFLGTNES